MSAQIANKSASYAATILKRIAAASGAPLRTNEIKQRPSLLTATEDESVERELNHALSVIDELKTKRSAALSHIPPSFIANPTINFAGFKSMAERLKERTPHAAKWLALIQQNETTFNNDDIKLDPMVEDAIVNALVPVERSFADFNKTINLMSETAQIRIKELEADLAKTEKDIENIEHLDIAAIEAEHPDWQKEANHNIEHHHWNTVENEHDKDAHH